MKSNEGSAVMNATITGDGGLFDDGTQVVGIPENHNCIGTCDRCGGPVVSSMMYSTVPWCMQCGARTKQVVHAQWGPLVAMECK